MAYINQQFFGAVTAEDIINENLIIITGSITNGSNLITSASALNNYDFSLLRVSQSVYSVSNGINSTAYITNITGSTITLSQTSSLTQGDTIGFSTPPGTYFFKSASFVDPNNLLTVNDISGSNLGKDYAVLAQAQRDNTLITGRFHLYTISEVTHRSIEDSHLSFFVKWGEPYTEAESGDVMRLDGKNLAIVDLTDLGSLSPELSREIPGLENLPIGSEIAAWNIALNNYLTNLQPSSLNVIEVTYSELLNLKNTSALIPGQTYLLTDYMTTYTQPVTNVTKSSGVVEPLYIIATDVDKLHNECRSQLYPEDIIYYEITGDIGNTFAGQPVGTEGFTKGKIYRRVDTIRNNNIGTDWRHIEYNINSFDNLLFTDYTGCENNYIESNSLYHSIIDSNFIGNKLYSIFYNNDFGDYFAYNEGTIAVTNTGQGFYLNKFIGISGCTFDDNFINNKIDCFLINKDLTSYTDLYSQTNNIRTIFSLPNGDYRYKYEDNFGDTIIEEII